MYNHIYIQFNDVYTITIYIYNQIHTVTYIYVYTTIREKRCSGCQAWVLASLRLVWRWVWRGTSRCLVALGGSR